MDTMIYFIIIGAVVVLPVVFGLGCITNMYIRAKLYRMLHIKSNPIILKITSKDKRRIWGTILDFNDDLFFYKNASWVNDKGHIYREDLQDKGFYIKDENLKYEEGIPVLYVDFETMTPLDFGHEETTKETPLEIGAFLKAWIDNERAKLLAASNQLMLFVMVCLILSAVAAGTGYIAMQNSGQVADDMKLLKTHFGLTNATIAYPTAAPGGTKQGNEPIIINK